MRSSITSARSRLALALIINGSCVGEPPKRGVGWLSPPRKIMGAIEKIEERLRKYPDVRYEVGASSISVLPPSNDGFTVGLDVTQSTYTVSFNGWHEDFQEEEEALDCFAFGLSKECRLKECRRGSFAYRWTVESRQNGKWVADSETGLFFFPFWTKKEVRYLQNNLITSNQEGGS